MEEYPLQMALGKEVGRMVAKEHADNGVQLHMSKGVKEICKNHYGNVDGVILSDGTRLDVNMVIVGAGIVPSTSFLSRSQTSISLDSQGAIKCDPFLQSSVKDIFAAGDVCSFPYWYSGELTRVEHWINALD